MKLIVEILPERRGEKWRGADHSMSWTSWPAPSKWSNPNVRIGFGFERRHTEPSGHAGHSFPLSFLAAQRSVSKTAISKISVHRGVRRVRILRNSAAPRVFGVMAEATTMIASRTQLSVCRTVSPRASSAPPHRHTATPPHRQGDRPDRHHRPCVVSRGSERGCCVTGGFYVLTIRRVHHAHETQA